MARSSSSPAPSEDLIAAADGARARAIDEVSSLVRHEVANIAHIARAALESCAHGDIVSGHRRLLGVAARCDDLLRGVASYCGGGEADVCTVAEVGHVARGVLARRPGRICLTIAPEVESLSVRLPRSSLALVLLEIAAPLETEEGGGLALTLRARDAGRAILDVVSTPALEPPPWRLAWARAALLPCGAELHATAAGVYVLELQEAS